MELSTAKKIYKTAPTELQTALAEEFGNKVLSDDICDIIQTLEDVYELNGTTESKVIPFPGTVDPDQLSTNADAIIKQITKAYNQGVKIDFDNKKQYKYYLYFTRDARGGWVLDGVCGYFNCAGLGAGSYFVSERVAKDAYKKFKKVWDDYLPK